MLLSEPLARLITFLRTSLMKFYLKSQQQMLDSFDHITESSELNFKVLRSKTNSVGDVLEFCVG